MGNEWREYLKISMKYYFSIQPVHLNKHTMITSLSSLAFKTWRMTQHAFISDIPSQMHPYHITLVQVILIFMLVVK